MLCPFSSVVAVPPVATVVVFPAVVTVVVVEDLVHEYARAKREQSRGDQRTRAVPIIIVIV